MGLDYAYELYVDRRQIEAVLQSLTPLVRVEEEYRAPLTVVLPDYQFTLPYGNSHWKGDRLEARVQGSQSGTVCCLSLWFEADEVLEADRQKQNAYFESREESKDARVPTDKNGRINVGCIYLRIEWDTGGMSSVEGTFPLACLSFTAATTSMSHVFEESTSIRDTFGLLSAECQAEYALLDREDQGAILLWWQGQHANLKIPSAYMTQQQIAEHMARGEQQWQRHFSRDAQ